MPHGNSRGLNDNEEFHLSPPRWALGDGDDGDTSPGRSVFNSVLSPLEVRSSSPSTDEFGFGNGLGGGFGSGSQRYTTPLTSPGLAPPPFTLVTPTSLASERISPFLHPQPQPPQSFQHAMGSPQLSVGHQAPLHFPRTTSLPSLNDGITLRQPMQSSVRSISIMPQQPQQPQQQQSVRSGPGSATYSPPHYFPLNLGVHNESTGISSYHNSPGFLAPSLSSPQQLHHPFGSIPPVNSSATPPPQGFGSGSSAKRFPSFTPSYSPQPTLFNPVQVQLQPAYSEDTQRTLGQVPRQSSQPLLIYNRGASQQVAGRSNSIYPRTQSFHRLYPRVLSDTVSANNSAHGSGSGSPVSPYSQPTTPTLSYGTVHQNCGAFGRKATSRPTSGSATRSASISTSQPASPLSSPMTGSVFAPSISVTAAPAQFSSARSMIIARHRRVLLEVTATLFPGQGFSHCFKPLSSQEWTKYLSEREKVLSQRVSPLN